MVRHRSSTIPHSLLVVDSSCGHSWCLCFRQMGQSWRMWWTICSVSLQSQSAESMMPIRFTCARRPVSCSQPEYSGLLMSCQTVDWVSRGVVVSSGSFPFTFLAVSEQGFGFLVSGSGHGLQLLTRAVWLAEWLRGLPQEGQAWVRFPLSPWIFC